MYKHFAQINPFCCGAACMQMVYLHFGLTIVQENIWTEIERPNKFSKYECDPEKMQKHFHAHGFYCINVLSIADFQSKWFLSWVESLKIPTIINYKLGENHYHFILFEQTSPNGILAKDPSGNSQDTFIAYTDLKSPQFMLVDKGTHSVRCPHCKSEFPSCEIITELYRKHVARCAYCQQELFYVEPS